jgi:hypothetical protein
LGRATLEGSADPARFFGFVNSWKSGLVALVQVETVGAYPMAASGSSYKPGLRAPGGGYSFCRNLLRSPGPSFGHMGSSRNRPRPQRGLPVRVSPPFGGLLKATASGRGRLLRRVFLPPSYHPPECRREPTLSTPAGSGSGRQGPSATKPRRAQQRRWSGGVVPVSLTIRGVPRIACEPVPRT